MWYLLKNVVCFFLFSVIVIVNYVFYTRAVRIQADIDRSTSAPQFLLTAQRTYQRTAEGHAALGVYGHLAPASAAMVMSIYRVEVLILQVPTGL